MEHLFLGLTYNKLGAKANVVESQSGNPGGNEHAIEEHPFSVHVRVLCPFRKDMSIAY